MRTAKKVRFNMDIEIHIIHDENNNFRKKYWEIFAVDRFRFKNRINRHEKIITPILNKEHREEIYNRYFS